ncbi:MAG: hypothetical protein ACQESR_21850 [Planctomycetota bacterium]
MTKFRYGVLDPMVSPPGAKVVQTASGDSPSHAPPCMPEIPDQIHAVHDPVNHGRRYESETRVNDLRRLLLRLDNDSSWIPTDEV